MEVTFRRNQRQRVQYPYTKYFDAVVTDNEGQRWIWSEPIGEKQAEYQGPMGMLGRTHTITAYALHNLGLVPESLQYSSSIRQAILERFESHPEEFVPYYPSKRPTRRK